MTEKTVDAALFIAAAFLYCFICFAAPAIRPNAFGPHGTVSVEIKPGMSAYDVSVVMEKKGVVDSAATLRMWMGRLGIDRRLQPGTYKLTPNTEYCAAKELGMAKPEIFKVAVIPGMSFEQLAAALYRRVGASRELEAELASDDAFPKAMRPLLPSNPKYRAIYLLPETYFLSPGKNAARELVREASALWFERVVKFIPPDKMDKRFLLSRGIMASIVEGEAKEPEERALLSGIFYNRLAKKMRLQSCATVIYSWKEKKGVKLKKLSYSDLAIDYPYNTYLNAGLTPGPINIPSVSSWKSALHPQKTDYMFFFAAGDGSHIFSRTYDEHIRRQKEAGIR